MLNNRYWQDKQLKFSKRGSTQCTALLLSVCFFSSTGCSRPDADQLLSDYQQRLDRVLNLEPTELTLDPLPALPAIRELQHPIAESQLNLLDLVALRHCNLQQLVAERNNSLGKVMSPANLLGYELQLIQALQPCLHHPALSAKLQSDLQKIYQQKQQQLPWVLENFLTIDLTLRKQLTGQQRQLIAGASHAVAEPLTALKNLNNLKMQVLASHEGQYHKFTANYINQQLGVLYQGNFVADWQYSLRRSNAWLSRINLQLSKVDLTVLCRQSDKTTVLQNMMTQIFATKVQSYLAELDSLSYQLLPEFEQLYHGTALHSSVHTRMAQPAMQLRHLLKQHVSWYQQLQQQCRLKPPTAAA